jgi:hypothetical protein
MSIMPQGHDVFLHLSNKFNDPERELYYHLFGGKFMKRILSAFMAMLLLCLASSAVYAEDSLTAHHDCTTGHNNHYEDVAEKELPTRELTWLCVTFGCHYKDIEVATGGACYYSTDPTGASCYTYPIKKAYCRWCGRQILFETGERRYGSCLFVTNHH